MTEKKYWIADTEGVKAVVANAADRDEWTRVRGWAEATEPAGLEFQWARNVDHGGKGVMNHEALVLAEGRGWVPSGPDGYDDPAPAAEAKPTPKSTSVPSKE